MARTMSATQARVHFGELLRSVGETGEPIIVERGGKGAVVVIPLATYEAVLAPARGRASLERLDRLHELARRTALTTTPPDAAELVRQGRQEREEDLAQTDRLP